MNTEDYKGELDAAIQAELQKDTEFQTAYAALTSDDEKTAALETKRASILAKKAPEFFTDFKKASKIAEDQKIRAEKAEKGEKPTKEGDTPKEEPLSTTDFYALVNAKVPEEDVPDVKEAAKVLKVTIAEVLKNPIVIAQLKQKADFRATANANNIDPKRPSNKTISDSELLDRASKGETFAKDSPEAEQLFWARRGGKRS